MLAACGFGSELMWMTIMRMIILRRTTAKTFGSHSNFNSLKSEAGVRHLVDVQHDVYNQFIG